MWRRLVPLALLLTAAGVQAQDAQPAPPAGKGVIRGVVTAADSGRPIRGANVRVAGSNGLAEPRWARTDEQGRYEVRSLTADRYTLTASKVRYLAVAYGQRRPGESGRPIDVSATASVDGINFALPRGGVIVARVTDSFGDPLRGVLVRPLVARFTNGARQLVQAPGVAGSTTDDRGEVRLPGLPPGDYYLGTDPNSPRDGLHNAQTFHPGTALVAEARPVTLGLGGEIFATFPLVRARPARLSGVVLGSSGQPLVNPVASLARGGVATGMSRRLVLGGDGSFVEDHLPPGEYIIEVREPEFAVHRVRLFGDDVTGLVVVTRKPASVRGRITFEGGVAPKESVQIRPAFADPPIMPGISAGTVRWSGGLGPIIVNAEDNWTFEALIAGNGVMRLWPPATPWFLKAVLVDGKDVTETARDFSSTYDGKPVEIVLRPSGAEINGTVSDDRGQTTTDCTVVVFPDEPELWTPFSRFISTGRPNQEGRFSLNGLPAGRYHVAALEYLAPGEERNPEILTQLRGVSTVLSLSEGESRSINLRVSR